MAAPPDPRALADLAAEIAAEAADFLAEALAVRGADGLDASEVQSKSSPTDYVTEWDQASERLIRDRLADQRPDDGVLGEEGRELPGTSGVRWVVDPIDGTTNFVYGLPPFAVSIAAEFDDEVVAGAVADVVHREVFVASRGGGATCNGRPIGVSGCADLALALVATGFGYDPVQRGRQAEVLVSVLPSVRDVRRAGAASIDLCWVACGRLDAYWERGTAPWDHAAGGLIAAEAGATVGDLANGPLSREMAFASTPSIAEELRTLLKRSGAATT